MSMPQIQGTSASGLGSLPSPDVVEIGLLLPAAWADSLLEMSKRKHQTIGQLVRGMIDRGLVDDLASKS